MTSCPDLNGNRGVRSSEFYPVELREVLGLSTVLIRIAPVHSRVHHINASKAI